MPRWARVSLIVFGTAVVVVVAVLALPGTTGEPKMTGVIVASGDASIVATDQLGASEAILVSEVTAPEASWVVAYRVGMAGMPGALLGYVRVPAGTSANVSVPLDPAIRLTPEAVLTLNADRGVSGRFEFDPDRFDSSTDKPYYSDGEAVMTTITVAIPEDGNAVIIGDEGMPTP